MMSRNGKSRIQAPDGVCDCRTMRGVLAAARFLSNHLLEAVGILAEIVQPPRHLSAFPE